MYAVPVPRAISVNMLALRFLIEAQPRWKKGSPPQRTTGVERRSSIQAVVRIENQGCARCPGTMYDMPKTRIANVNDKLAQKRSTIDSSSGFLGSAATMRGSRVIPHFGHEPALSRTISGCIGQVYSTRVSGAVRSSGSSAMPHLGQGPALLSRTSGSIGQT